VTGWRHIVPSRAKRGRLAVSEAELREWGEKLGESSAAPLILTLSGELGTGKTTLAQAICRGYLVREEVTSPTYALVHEYSSPRSPVFHVDLYRLDSPEQLSNIGWNDIISSQSLVIVEWPDRAADRLPADHVPIDLEYIPGDDSHRILLAG
jgi:tRNA threonylcarbamoyl adenosine modification protein YjeE